MLTRLRQLLSPGQGPPLREVTASTGWYPLIVLTALNTVDEMDRVVLGVFSPNLKRYFDIGNTEVGAVVALQVFAVIVFAVPIGYLGTKMDRPRILRWSAGIWALFSVSTAFALKIPLFLLTRFGAGVSRASVEPVGRSLLTDYYPPNGWNRVLAFHTAGTPLGLVLGPALAGIIGVLATGDGKWRWAFGLLAVPTAVVLLAARRLREPENQAIRSLTGAMLTVSGAPSDLGFMQATRRLLRIRTFRRQVFGIGVLGFALIGFLAFINILLDEEFGVGEGGRGLIGVGLASANLLGTIVGGNVGERVFERSPKRTVSLIGLGLAVYTIVAAVGVFMPNLWLFLPIQWVALLFVSVIAAPLYAALSSVTPPRLRPLMFSLLGICIALFGGMAGGIFVGAVADATNVRIGLASIAPFGVIGGLLMARGAATIEDDIALIEHDPMVEALRNAS